MSATSPRKSPVDVAIIGGGLAGLHLAFRLQQRSIDYVLLEARPRLGGRVFTELLSLNGQSVPLDLGAAWFWPDQQPLIDALVDELGVPIFDQPMGGEILVERFRFGGVQRYSPRPGQAMRVKRFARGSNSLIDALVTSLSPDRILVRTQATALASDAGIIRVELSGAISHVMAKQVVVALPPRLVVTTLDFNPLLPLDVVRQLADSPTWIANQAKLLVAYDRPFWRDDGLSGLVSSVVGPLQEIHDLSPPEGAGVLMGFFGSPRDAGSDNGQERLIDASLNQLVRLFGPAARAPAIVSFKDWAADAHTASADDRSLPGRPPQVIPANILDSAAPIHFCGSEFAQNGTGYLEGAIEAGLRILDRHIDA